MMRNDLIKYETEIAEKFEKGLIKAPIHLSKGNEDQLIEIFEQINEKTDWIFSTWRNHYHWLLFGLSSKELTQQILAKKSMLVSDPQHRFYTSSIVAGICPIALGVALSLKLKCEKGTVWCFIGDAAFECGITKECIRYAEGHDLPIKFVVEDNGKCVRADTQEVWGKNKTDKVIQYQYERGYPHAGTGKYIMF